MHISFLLARWVMVRFGIDGSRCIRRTESGGWLYNEPLPCCVLSKDPKFLLHSSSVREETNSHR